MSEHIERINQLLDGELDQMHEATLYGELAVNADLRNEMRDQLAIKTAVQEDRMALIPPVSLTSSLFSGLGFAAPLAGAAAGAAGGSMLLQWLMRLGIPILSAIAAVGLSIGISSDVGDHRVLDGEATSTETASHTQPESGPQVSEAESQRSAAIDAQLIARLRTENDALRDELRASRSERVSTPAQSAPYRDPALASQLAAALAENDQLRRELAASTQREQDREALMAQQPVEQTDADRTVANEPLISQMQITNTIDLNMNKDHRAISQRPMSIEGRRKAYPQSTLQLRGFSLTPTVSTFVAEQGEWYNNIGVSYMYLASPNIAFGAEVGSEAYPMVFEGEENDQLIRYEQYPTSMWAGITYRYTFNQMGEVPLAPYVQGLVGGSSYGPVGRASAGLQYSPVGPLTFILGLEASVLTYTYQNSWFLSPKYGVTYGLAYRF